MSYCSIIKGLLDQQYPDIEHTETIIITTLQLRIIPKATQPLFLRYTQLETLVLNKCDLRNL